ncbi:MAG: putative toxin-antitoxin system toxin component, PIN family [Gammaproteobacteria bacterium]|nr:putative toxin-antitoxin system toxin component, PIN family [Gammaproteobacteria bacterium]
MRSLKGSLPTRAEGYVFDTNVLISAALRPSSVPNKALEVVEKRGGALLFSTETLAELETRLCRPKFDRYIDDEGRARYTDRLQRVSELVRIYGRQLGCRDPDDDKFLEVALRGEARYLVSGDQDLLVVSPFRGVDILRPADFLLV